MKKYRVFSRTVETLFPYPEFCEVCKNTLKYRCFIVANFVIRANGRGTEEWVYTCSDICTDMWILQNI